MLTDKVQIKEVYNLYVTVKATNLYYIDQLKGRRDEAGKLLVLIQKEYDLSERTPLRNIFMEVHATPTLQEKMDTLSLGISHVVPRHYSWLFCRKPERTLCRTPERIAVYAINGRGSEIGYYRINSSYSPENRTE
jgi:hypothetical protein